MGAQWLRGRVLDSRPRGCGVEPKQCHCVVSLSKTYYSLLSSCSTQEDPSENNLKIGDWDVKTQITQAKFSNSLPDLVYILCGTLGHWIDFLLKWFHY